MSSPRPTLRRSFRRSFPRVRWVAFDLDDTLLLTFENAFRKVVHVASRLRREPPSHREFRADYGRLSLAGCVAKWLPGLPLARFLDEYERAGTRFPRRAVTDFAPIRRALVDGGYRVGILTNAPERKLAAKLAAANVSFDELDFVFCAERLPRPKPDPRCFAPLLSASGLSPEQHVYFGDAPTDRLACRAAGIPFVPVNSGPTEWTKGSHHGLILSTVAELLPMLTPESP